MIIVPRRVEMFCPGRGMQRMLILTGGGAGVGTCVGTYRRGGIREPRKGIPNTVRRYGNTGQPYVPGQHGSLISGAAHHCGRARHVDHGIVRAVRRTIEGRGVGLGQRGQPANLVVFRECERIAPGGELFSHATEMITRARMYAMLVVISPPNHGMV